MGTLMGTAVGLELGPIVMLGTSVEAKNKQTKKQRRRTANNWFIYFKYCFAKKKPLKFLFNYWQKMLNKNKEKDKTEMCVLNLFNFFDLY